MCGKHLFPIVTVLICLCLSLAGCASGGGGSPDTAEMEAEAVEIGDPNLDEAIREALEKPGGELTVEELAGLEELNAPIREIASLDGLEHAVNLRSLNLYRNKISDLTPLGGLEKLEVLILTSNEIKDISPLGGLNNLQELNLSENRISDLSLVQWENLAALENLDLRYNYLRLSDPDTAEILKVIRQAGVNLQVEPTYYD